MWPLVGTLCFDALPPSRPHPQPASPHGMCGPQTSPAAPRPPPPDALHPRPPTTQTQTCWLTHLQRLCSRVLCLRRACAAGQQHHRAAHHGGRQPQPGRRAPRDAVHRPAKLPRPAAPPAAHLRVRGGKGAAGGIRPQGKRGFGFVRMMRLGMRATRWAWGSMAPMPHRGIVAVHLAAYWRQQGPSRPLDPTPPRIHMRPHRTAPRRPQPQPRAPPTAAWCRRRRR